MINQNGKTAINLASYDDVYIREHYGKYLLCAAYRKKSNDYPLEEVLGSFDDEDQAVDEFRMMMRTMNNGKWMHWIGGRRTP